MGTGFRDFIRAFGVQWFVAMSGGLGVPLTAVGVFFAHDVQKIFFFATAVFCAVFSCFWIWSVERERANKEKARADAAQDQLDERYCTLSIGALTCIRDHLSITRWVIPVINDVPAPAEDVQIELVNIEPRPRDDRWLGRSQKVPCLLERAPAAPTIAVGRSEDFVPIVESGRTDTEMVVISNIATRDIFLFPDESWTLHYEMFAKNSKALRKFSLRLSHRPKQCFVELLS